MKRISHFAVLKEAPVNSSHERIFEVTARLQLESCEREADDRIKEYEKRIKELQETCTQWERLSKEVDDNEKEAELKKVKEEIEKFSWYRNELSRDILISEADWPKFWGGGLNET